VLRRSVRFVAEYEQPGAFRPLEDVEATRRQAGRVTAPAFSYLREIETENERMVDQNSASWNQLLPWLRRLDILRGAQVLAG